ncbi:hypothetical protein FGADI_5416 [Fusarium gaditjirri]|uniref:DUF7918 domain-containing protein n=1 Tax=Fusarium gaditjirri TaxID=282569 RepID=A0A8H4TA93_9HYPO|nr:hypothetical protein FGADI_5416 [Fusarium gaditjirri]
MAIRPQVPGLSVSIRVDHQPAEEYHPPHITPVRDPHLDDEVAVTHCFIESQTGKDFRVRYRFSPLFTFPDGADFFIIKFFVDGIKCQEQLIRRTALGGARENPRDQLPSDLRR